MNREDVLEWIQQYETRCHCGKQKVSLWQFEYASDLISWLEGEPIYHLGLLGCCEDEEE